MKRLKMVINCNSQQLMYGRSYRNFDNFRLEVAARPYTRFVTSSQEKCCTNRVEKIKVKAYMTELLGSCFLTNRSGIGRHHLGDLHEQIVHLLKDQLKDEGR